MVTQIDTGRSNNIFLIRGRTGYILIDSGALGRTDFILEQLKKNGVAPGDLSLILITHGHSEHYGNAAALRERTGAPIAIHALDADAARQGIDVPGSFKPTSWWVALLMRTPSSEPLRACAFEPDVTFETEFRLDDPASPLGASGVAGRVIHTPGHTPGSVSVLLDSGEAIVGDMVWVQLLGLVRKPGLPIVAWNIEQNRESIRRLISLSPRLVYVGHGGPFADLSGLVRPKPTAHT